MLHLIWLFLYNNSALFLYSIGSYANICLASAPGLSTINKLFTHTS